MKDKEGLGTIAMCLVQIVSGMCAVVFGLLVLTGGHIEISHAERDSAKDDARAAVITNAVTTGILEAQEPLTCKDAAIIEVIRRLTEQGVHVKHFTLEVKMDDKLESEDE